MNIHSPGPRNLPFSNHNVLCLRMNFCLILLKTFFCFSLASVEGRSQSVWMRGKTLSPQARTMFARSICILCYSCNWVYGLAFSCLQSICAIYMLQQSVEADNGSNWDTWTLLPPFKPCLSAIKMGSCLCFPPQTMQTFLHCTQRNSNHLL